MAIADNSVIVFVKGASPFAKERGNTKQGMIREKRCWMF